jgi:hypothetical protein
VTTHHHDHIPQTQQGDPARVTATTDNDTIPTPPPPPPVVLAAFVRAGVYGARLVADYVTDHDGWCLTLGLPPGVTVADAQARRDRLVAALGWPDEQTWLLATGDPTRLVVSFRQHPADPIIRPWALPTGDELDQDSPLAWPARIATAAAAGATLACAVLITHLVTTGYPPTAAHATLLTVLAGVIVGLAASWTTGRYWHGRPPGGNGVVLGLASLALAGLAVVTGHTAYGFAIVTANGLLEAVPAILPGRIIHYLEHARWARPVPRVTPLPALASTRPRSCVASSPTRPSTAPPSASSSTGSPPTPRPGSPHSSTTRRPSPPDRHLAVVRVAAPACRAARTNRSPPPTPSRRTTSDHHPAQHHRRAAARLG